MGRVVCLQSLFSFGREKGGGGKERGGQGEGPRVEVVSKRWFPRDIPTSFYIFPPRFPLFARGPKQKEEGRKRKKKKKERKKKEEEEKKRCIS